MSEDMKLKEDLSGRIVVEGITDMHIETRADLAMLLARGELNRYKRWTAFNESSSRSHSIVELTLYEADQPISVLTMCDLAGSERSSQDQIKDKAYFSELKHINMSLSTLGK